MSDPAPLVFLSAGETSGDHYGAEIITHLREHDPNLRFTGLGGVAMERAGQHRLVRAEDVAVMGITEILRHVPRIYALYRRLVRAIRRDAPAVAVLIDFPDVNFRLARHLKRLGVPVVWFASPQLWAWKRRRLRWVQERVDRMLVLFPFEERFYRARGVRAEFVGHPFAALPSITSTRAGFAAAHPTTNPARTWIALLPGSRWKELAANLPTMLEAAAALGPGYDLLIPVASALSTDSVRDLLDGILARLAWPADSSITLVPDAAEALHHARAAVVASGTATILAAVIGTPFVVVYRVSPLTFRIARHLVRYPAELPAEPDADGILPIGMVNLIAGRRIVPELLNERFTAQAVIAALTPLLTDTPARVAQFEALAEVSRTLAHPGPVSGTARVAEIVVELLNARTHLEPRTEVRSPRPRV